MVVRDLLIPLSILELIKDPREVEILFEMLDRLLPLDIGRCPRLMSIDVVPPHYKFVR
jgi:hypothetical protein